MDQLRPAFVLSFDLIVLAIYWPLTCRPTVKQMCTENIKCKHWSYHLSWLHVQFNNFKWNLDLFFEVNESSDYDFLFLILFLSSVEHNREFFKYALDTLFNIMKENGEWDCQAPKETKKGLLCRMCTIFQLFWSYTI